MLHNFFLLLLSLGIILLSCELFTNGIEWLGNKLGVGDGVVGSIFSAVGTCLPETMIPVIAIIFSDKNDNLVSIGIGAIVGAPFMLSTLAFFITGASVLLFWKKRRKGMRMNVNSRILGRDIGFFILLYSTGILAAFIHSTVIKNSIAFFLIACYLFYIFITIKDDNVSHGTLAPLYMARFFNQRESMSFIFAQLAFSITAIIFGAELFVENIKFISGFFGVSALALSLIIAPIATELPEKFNSIIWISRRKDTLALGNITGAMVFQSCIPVAIGIIYTPWELDLRVMVSVVLAILSALVTYSWLKVRKSLSPIPLLTGGFFYTLFICFLATGGFH